MLSDRAFAVTFLPAGRTVKVRKETTILEASVLADIFLSAPCGGNGSCNKCKVRIAGKAELVCACQYAVHENIKVILPAGEQRERVSQLKSGSVQLPANFQFVRRSGQETRFGAAVDLGTTTVAALLWDMWEGRLIAEVSVENPQRSHGADVVSRITYAETGKTYLAQLQKEAVGCISDCLSRLMRKTGIGAESIGEAVIVGNPTMIHLLFGQSVKPLAEAPFCWRFQAPAETRADRLGFTQIRSETTVRMLPAISGHIGSDITASILAAQLQDQGGSYLLMDLGTNGELVLKAGERWFACSTAIGPALEGGSVSCGMIARAGAVDRIEADQDGTLIPHVIGQGTATGICGSGLIDCAAKLLETNRMDASGRLLRYGQAQDGEAVRLCENVTVTQQDIRQLQLAKAAVAAGVRLLLREADLEVGDLDGLFLAGAFGSYIRKKSAVQIGLIPNIEMEKIMAIGNAAGIGASMALLSDVQRKTAQQIVGEIQRIELAEQSDFEKLYLEEMNFN